MPIRPTSIPLAALLIAALAASPVLAQPAPGGGPGRGAQAPKSVGTVIAELSDVPQIVTLPGRAVAYEVATVRPRVGGLIEDITYEPGRLIDAGAPMFRMETATLQATLDAAKATELGATQARDNAQATVDRYTALENRGVTRADLQAAQVALTQADATLVTAQVARQTAQLELDRAVIPAPIAGYTSETSATIGSLVTANQADALATVTRIDPIYVDLAASSAQILEGRQKVREGVMSPVEPPRIEVTLENGSLYDKPGEIVSAGSTVSQTTGTLDLRVKFPNPDRMILPGQFLRVNMTIGTVRAVLVPQRATTRLADGSLAVFVLKDGRAVRQTLTEVGVSKNAWAVTEGVAAGDAVIVDGLANLNDGQVVAAVGVTLDDNGVVIPATTEGGTPWAEPAAAQAAAAPDTQKAGWWARLRSAVGLGPAEQAASGSSSTAAAPATSTTATSGGPGPGTTDGAVRPADPMAAPEGTTQTPAASTPGGATPQAAPASPTASQG